MAPGGHAKGQGSVLTPREFPIDYFVSRASAGRGLSL
jgi:hypothetical protein